MEWAHLPWIRHRGDGGHGGRRARRKGPGSNEPGLIVDPVEPSGTDVEEAIRDAMTDFATVSTPRLPAGYYCRAIANEGMNWLVETL